MTAPGFEYSTQIYEVMARLGIDRVATRCDAWLSLRAGPISFSSTFGCGAAGWTVFSCLIASSQQHPELPIVMISGHGNNETAVSAYDFIEKPFKADRLLLMADRALENSRLKHAG